MVVPAQPAATVVLARPVADTFEVFLVKRHGRSGFMAGAHVFPGGRVEDADREAARALDDEARTRAATLCRDLPADDAAAYALAAVRETHEECGVRLPSVDALAPLAWWITPEAEPKRFDTRFFLAEAPADQVARSDQQETTEGDWFTPRAALDAYAAGRIHLAPPTLATLEDLAAAGTLAAARAAADLSPIQPVLTSDDDGTMVLALPGDPLHPVRARCSPRRTRVVMDASGRFVSR